ncbi:unnamed protein product [Closterium sp. NIES-54]
MVTTTTTGGQRVAICTCTWTGSHLATSRSCPLFMSPPVAPESPLAPPPWSPLPATPSWHALPLPFSGLHISLPPLPPSRAPPCLAGEFSSDLLREFCHGEGILQSFTLPASPQQNGVAECRIGLVMEVARTSMIHAAAPHFLWPFAVRYVAHQLNLWPRVSLPETSPTMCWTGKVGDASVFRVWGSRAFVPDTSADKLSSRAIRFVFLGFPPDAPGWKFYHPTLRCVLPSQDVTFDESVPFYDLFPYRTAPSPPPRRFSSLQEPPLVVPFPPQGPAPSGVSQVDPLPLAEPVEVAVDSGNAWGVASRGAELASAKLGGAEPESAEPGGAESEGAESGGSEPEGTEPGGAEPEGAEPGGAESEGAESGVSPARASLTASVARVVCSVHTP